MTKAEEILQEVYLKETESFASIRTPRVPAYLEPIVLQAMKEYAMLCLKQASENAQVKTASRTLYSKHVVSNIVVDKESIVNPDNLV